ncbi:hypothetical protein DUK53_05325 [Listeria sp. SHR_NRA_18]|uniref:hypothetical protein n=1 Tax=Listeria sp. SHR_NRA_18 TaxID=2269046 RepID=UPI000F5FCC4B|nr:hypothetical protein [Listeria sp. SHR_NRA_18]RQW67739.1 hypothetical protein DUK53_05325 [Listeria sp. SHR_NRA_18]
MIVIADFMVIKRFNSKQDDMEVASKEQILSLLDNGEESQDIKDILDNIVEEKCNIAGSAQIIKLFNQINNKKDDMRITVEDISLVGFDEKQLILSFNEESTDDLAFTAKGIYSFSTDFLDKLFSMSKFARYCFKVNEIDFLRDSLDYLLDKTDGKMMQYRFISGTGKNKEDMYIRAITSNQYRNFDNNIVLYLCLVSIHNYSKVMNKKAYIEQAYITDSSLDLTIKLDEKIKLNNYFSIEVGINITNSEIREGAVLFEFIYTISDKNGKKSTAMGDTVIKIQHNNKFETVGSKMKMLHNLKDHTDGVLNGINVARLATKLDENVLFSIFKNLASSKTLEKGTRSKLEKLHKEEITSNTLTIIELFEKLEQLNTSVDDKTYIQKKFNDFLTNGLK